MKTPIRPLALAFSALCVSGCVMLVPLTRSDGGGGTPSQRGESMAPVDMSSSPSFQPGAGGYHNNRTMTRAEIRSERTYRKLITQLQNGTAAERTCAATDLGRLQRPHSDLIPPLARALRTDDNKWVRRAAARSLGRLKNPAATQPLREALRDRDHWVAHSAANALSQISTARETS